MIKQILFQELKSENSAARNFAIGQIMRDGNSQDVLDALLARKEVENDLGCRLLLDMAVATVQTRIEEQKRPISLFSPLDFWKRFDAGDRAERVSLLTRIPAPQIPDQMKAAISRLAGEHDPVVIEVMIRMFQRCWPMEHARSLLDLLRHPSYGLRLVALETLAMRAPDRLLDELPSLLVDPDPLTVFLAIRGLAATDLDEALQHLGYHFQGTNEAGKLAGLRLAFFLPFDQVKPLLLNFLALEEKPDLLEIVSLLFVSNPDPQVPFRLWEIAEQATPAKATFIRKLMAEVGEALRHSGLLNEDFGTYQERLQDWIRQRAATRVVQACLATVSATDSVSEEDLQAMLLPHMTDQRERRVFVQSLNWALPARVKQLVQGCLDQTSKEGTPSAAGKVSLREFESADPRTRIRLISALRPEQREAAQPILRQILQGGATSAALRAGAFRTSQRLGLGDFAAEARALLQDSDAQLAAAALEYLGEFDRTRVLPLLPPFLQSPNPRLQSAAMRTLQKADPRAALSTVRTCLAKPDRQQRLAILASLIHLDFSMVREDLTSFLIRNPDSAFFDLIMSYFQANPDPANLACLMRLEAALGKQYGMLLGGILAHQRKTILELGLANQAALQQLETKARSKIEAERARRTMPAYAFAALHPRAPTLATKDESGWWNEARAKAKDLWNAIPLGWKLAAATVCGIILWFLLH